jgi:hypothetical protein
MNEESHPNKALALDICKHLLETLAEEDERLKLNKLRDDPQGDTLTLAVAIFFGIYLSRFKNGMKYRQYVADAALGYSMNIDDVLPALKDRGYQR